MVDCLKNELDPFNRFDRTQVCDGQTEGHSIQAYLAIGSAGWLEFNGTFNKIYVVLT